MQNQTKAYGFALLAVLFWSTVATAFKLALEGLSVLQLLAVCIYTSFLVNLGLVMFTKSYKQFGFSIRKQLPYFLLGVLNPLLYYLILFKAYSLLPAQLAQPLNMIWPIVLVFFAALFLKQNLKLRNIISLLICLLGVLLISSKGSLQFTEPPNWYGVLLATGSSVVWSLYWVLNTKLKEKEELKLFYSFFYASIAVSFTLFFGEGFSFKLNKAFIAGVYAGLFEMGITFLFWLRAMHLSASANKISVLVYLSPLISLLFIRFILKEELYLTTFIGILIIIFGILYDKQFLTKNTAYKK